MDYTLENFNEQEAHKKFKQLNITKRYSVKQIENILKSKYNAEEVEVKFFLELNNDPFFNSAYLTKCYAIKDKFILDSLFNDDEKLEHSKFIKENGFIHDSKIEHNNIEDRLHALSQGSLLYIFFQSQDRKYLNYFISTHGPCEQMMLELTLFKGIKDSDCVIGKMDYTLYLLALAKLGYIKI